MYSYVKLFSLCCMVSKTLVSFNVSPTNAQVKCVQGASSIKLISESHYIILQKFAESVIKT